MTASFRGFSAILRDLSAADPKNKIRYGGTLTDRKGDTGDGRGEGRGEWKALLPRWGGARYCTRDCVDTVRVLASTTEHKLL